MQAEGEVRGGEDCEGFREDGGYGVVAGEVGIELVSMIGVVSKGWMGREKVNKGSGVRCQIELICDASRSRRDSSSAPVSVHEM